MFLLAGCLITEKVDSQQKTIMSQINEECAKFRKNSAGQIQYPAEFIQKTVCNYYRSGMTIVGFLKDKEIPRGTFMGWLTKFSEGKETLINSYMSKDSRTQALESENAQLKQQLAQMKKDLDAANFRAHAWETMVDVAEEMFNIPIKKKVGTKQ